MHVDSETVSFYKLSRSNKKNGFLYLTRDANGQDMTYQGVRLPESTFTINLQIINSTAEDIILCANHNSSPTVIPASKFLYSDSRKVVVKIIYTQVNKDKISGYLTYNPKITEIEVTENTLRESIVFIDEIDAYLSFRSNFNVIRDQIRDDSLSFSNSDTRIVSLNNVKADPALIYEKYKFLTENFMTRHERIRIYTGNKNKIKNVRLSMWDSYFSPYLFDRIIYDPTIPDSFVISFDRGYGDDDVRIEFSELERTGSIYIDPNEKETILGKFCGMVVFSDESHLINYFHRRKSEQRYIDENRYLSEHSGNIRLQAEIDDKERQIVILKATVEIDQEKISDLTSKNKQLVSDKKFLETQIDELVNGGIVNRSAAIIAKKINIDDKRTDNDLYEMISKERITKATSKVSIFKNLGEILKTAFSIISTVVTVAPLVIKIIKPLIAR